MTAPPPHAEAKGGRGGPGRSRPAAALLLAALLLPGCGGEVARVGTIGIRGEDLSRRARVSEIRFPGSGSRTVALAQLVRGYLSLQLLASLGRPADDGAVEAEAARIDANTRDATTLGRIKAVYGSDRRAYLDTFVRVEYAERFLYNEVFRKDRSLHAPRLREAEALRAAASREPPSLPRLAAARGYRAEQLLLSTEEGVRRAGGGAAAPAEPPVADASRAARRIDALAGVPPGGVAPAVLEWEEGFEVLRVVGRRGATWRVEAVLVPRRGYDDWLWEACAPIPVRVFDRELREAFLREISWAGRTALAP